MSSHLRRPRGRYAPSPTGLLHLGNARTALVAWLSIRAGDGAFVWRLEDLDAPRAIPGADVAAMEDLAWLGIDWDEGPDRGGAYAPYTQSERTAHYERSLRLLLEQRRIFPCRLSRKDLRDLASAPHGTSDSPYPPSLRPRELAPDWYERLVTESDAAVRFMVHDQPVRFTDLVHGAHEEEVSVSVGDFVLRRRDLVYAYQLAVVVDDLEMEITEVVRGSDLLSSTARQVQLMEALGGQVPAFAHVPLVLNSAGEKLSKRDEGLTLRALRDRGAAPEQVVGYMAWSLGLTSALERCSAAALVDAFSWNRIGRADFTLPPDAIDQILAL